MFRYLYACMLINLPDTWFGFVVIIIKPLPWHTQQQQEQQQQNRRRHV